MLCYVNKLAIGLTKIREVVALNVNKLAIGLTKIREVVALNEQSGSNHRFLDSMTMFVMKPEDDIVKIEDEERVSILMVKDVTEYFHGTPANKTMNYQK
ncbi:formin, FH2 domain-containing protein [Artemisia annua]|uniref:Formin, FH2 domain-containing protein n=1 Tax=Artemisia annua TaxID=35608 RepID=A0A2U1NEZ6_ARTAN|nr:formin, FH2 domain-containing protein [Artemisia annua]